MNYPANHPFSDSYVSQIPLAAGEARSRARIRYLQRIRDSDYMRQPVEGEPKLRTVLQGQCPLCVGYMGKKNRKERRFEGVRRYVCAICADQLTAQRKAA